MKLERDWAAFLPPARFAYRYRWRILGWFLEGHVFLREAFHRAWPKAVRRELAVNERIVEVPFVLRELDLVPGSRILDVGSQWSVLPLQLAALGYRTVASDLAGLAIRGSGAEVVQADIRMAPFRSGSFDAATMVSTLEHIGVGFYDQPGAEDADAEVMKELGRVVKPRGLVLLTVPFGRSGVGPLQRSYDRARLNAVTAGWTWELARFYKRDGASWVEVPEEQGAAADSARQTNAVAALRLRRPES